MNDMLDCRREASGCFKLAASETHPEMKTILVSMARSWLVLADQVKQAATPADPTGDQLVVETA
jgi:hypothetical protein